ncbi:unnamed protein product, partial [Dovyalis caffra]
MSVKALSQDNHAGGDYNLTIGLSHISILYSYITSMAKGEGANVWIDPHRGYKLLREEAPMKKVIRFDQRMREDIHGKKRETEEEREKGKP